MYNKVTWKRGMRLSPEVFNAMDRANENAIHMAAMLGSANRYGLFTANRNFELSINVNGNVLEVTSLNCHGITKSGCIIDIEYDSNYVNTFDTRVPIPAAMEGEAFYLVVKIDEGKWREINETYSEIAYTFDLIGENNIISDNCLPIGLLVNQYGWRLNETDFVPPCLYVSSHPKFEEQLDRAKYYAKDLFAKCLTSQACAAKTLLATIWQAASTVYSYLDKQRDTLTPGQLYHCIDLLITSFVVGCYSDEFISLENQDSFTMYLQKSYDAKTIYKDIETGLSLCAEISAKMAVVCSKTQVQPPVEEAPAPKPAPRPAVPEVKPTRNRWEGLEI